MRRAISATSLGLLDGHDPGRDRCRLLCELPGRDSRVQLSGHDSSDSTRRNSSPSGELTSLPRSRGDEDLGAADEQPLHPDESPHARVGKTAASSPNQRRPYGCCFPPRSSFRPRAQGKGWSGAAGSPESRVSLGTQVSGPPRRATCSSPAARRRVMAPARPVSSVCSASGEVLYRRADPDFMRARGVTGQARLWTRIGLRSSRRSSHTVRPASRFGLARRVAAV